MVISMKDKILKRLVLIIMFCFLIGIGYYMYIIFNFFNGNEYFKFLINTLNLIILFNFFILFSEWLIRYCYPLLASFCTSITYFATIFSCFWVLFNANYIFSILLTLLSTIYFIIIIINCIKDLFIGKQEIILNSFRISFYRRPFKSRHLFRFFLPNYYILNGKDINGNEIELKSLRKIMNRRCDLKIKYYKNIRWIESFEYVEK